MLSLVTAVIKPFAVDLVRDALQSMEVPGLTVSARDGVRPAGRSHRDLPWHGVRHRLRPEGEGGGGGAHRDGRGWSPTRSARWPDPARSATARSGSPRWSRWSGSAPVSGRRRDLRETAPTGQMSVRNLSATGHGRATPLARPPCDRRRMGTVRARRLCAPLGVSVLRLPADAHVRDHLATFRQPRILLVEPGVQPPVLLDELEDWMRTPADPDDLRARGRELHRRALDAAPAAPARRRRRACCGSGRSWVDLTPAQAPVVSLLVEHLERVVRYDAVALDLRERRRQQPRRLDAHAADPHRRPGATGGSRAGHRAPSRGAAHPAAAARGRRSSSALAPRGGARSADAGRWHRCARGRAPDRPPRG